MDEETTTLTATQTRTRTAILRAALPLLNRNGSASLGDVADEARVARSTLYRYFPDRDHLTAALDDFAGEEWTAALANSRADEGLGLDAFVRLCVETLDCWDAVMWTYARHQASCETAESVGSDPDIVRIVERGIVDGSITDAFPVEWIESMFWTILYGANEFTTIGRTRHDTQTHLVTTIRRLLAAQP